MRSTAMFWILWLITIATDLYVIHDYFTVSYLSEYTAISLIFATTLSFISYGYWSERQDVCS